jgi:hypothetical protein
MGRIRKRGVFYRNKNGYFFIVDAFMGTIIIVMTLVIIMNSHLSAPDSTTTYTVIGDYIKYISTTEIQDINNNIIKEMVNNNLIKDTENTLLIQNVRFYYENGTACPNCIDEYAYNFTRQTVEGVIPDQYGFEYLINNTEIYSKNKPDLINAELYLTGRRVVYLYINETYIFGPVNVTIAMWE